MLPKHVLGAIKDADLATLRQLDSWIHILIADREAEEKVYAQYRARNRPRQLTYQQEYVRCGKDGCKCAGGAGHGPYWYAYWTEGDKTRKKYIGKTLPQQHTAGADEPLDEAAELAEDS